VVQLTDIERFVRNNSMLFEGRRDEVLRQASQVAPLKDRGFSLQQLVNLLGPLETEELVENLDTADDRCASDCTVIPRLP
jgi:hypothetical protein